ncbi:zf-HC2 domain-containing protein [Myxococcaceae bacterium GXIMD 01537]
MSSPCREHELDALLTGELPAPDAERVRAHAESCAACARTLAWLRMERGWMAQRARREPSRPALGFAALEARLSAAARPARPRATWAHRGKMAMGAAAAVFFVMFSFAQTGVRPSLSEDSWDEEALRSTPGLAEVCVDSTRDAVAALEASVGACLLASPALASR